DDGNVEAGDEDHAGLGGERGGAEAGKLPGALHADQTGGKERPEPLTHDGDPEDDGLDEDSDAHPQGHADQSLMVQRGPDDSRGPHELGDGSGDGVDFVFLDAEAEAGHGDYGEDDGERATDNDERPFRFLQ